MIKLLEESLYVLLLGVPLTGAMVFAWIRTTTTPFLGIAIALLLLTIGGVIAEVLIVTDREAITEQLEQMADDVQEGDIQKILQHIHPDSPETRSRAETQLSRYTVNATRIAKIHELTVYRDRDPAEAEIKLNAVVDIASYRGPIAFNVTLRLEGDRWKVLEYEILEPLAHMRR